MTGLRPPGLVLGFHPTSRGFGWVVFEAGLRPVDWGLASARGDKNAICLRRLERLLDRFRPEVLVLEASDPQRSRRARRIAQLCAAAAGAADARGVETAVYSRAEVRAAFAEVRAVTRRQIAEAVAGHMEAFRHRLPKPRRPWESENAGASLFAAAALVMAHLKRGV